MCKFMTKRINQGTIMKVNNVRESDFTDRTTSSKKIRCNQTKQKEEVMTFKFDFKSKV